MRVHRDGLLRDFGDPDNLWPELQTQSYIFDYARSNPHPDAPRIPQVVHHFGNSRTKYLVMEFITLTAAPLDLIDRTAQALKRRGPTTVHAQGASVHSFSRASTIR
jgi:hypothetical protein